MEARPKLLIKLTKVDRAIEALCLIIIILLWTGTLAGFSKLPAQIPSHFNAAGQADDYSNKANIFGLPIIATVIYLGMTLLNRYPHIYNYSVTVAADNAYKLYKSATRLIRILKLAVVLIFFGIVVMTYTSVFTKNEGLGTWFFPSAMALLFLPTIIYLIKASPPKKSPERTT